MKLTKEQVLVCEKIAENGGPKSYAGAMLYHQYKLQKKQTTITKSTGEGETEAQIIQKVKDIQMLEKKIEEKKMELRTLIENIS